MITQNSNNKPSGYTGNTCDAGTPISGRTSTGEYQIIKVDTDGTVITSGNGGGGATPVLTVNYMGANPYSFAVAAASPGFYYTIMYAPPFLISTGDVYSINPALLFSGSSGGGITFMLIRVGSVLDAYVSTLNQGDFFAGASNNFATGLYGFWHNTAAQAAGGVVGTSFNRSNTIDCYLSVGSYRLYAMTEGNVTFTAGQGYAGFYQFSQI